jgi:hypothetical protein
MQSDLFIVAMPLPIKCLGTVGTLPGSVGGIRVEAVCVKVSGALLTESRGQQKT